MSKKYKKDYFFCKNSFKSILNWLLDLFDFSKKVIFFIFFWHLILILYVSISADVINIHTIKPLDEDIILKSVAKTGCIVTAEEHNIIGGLGESVARTLALNTPTPQEFIGTNDTFGESGTPAQLMEKYGLNAISIVNAVKKVISRK